MSIYRIFSVIDRPTVVYIKKKMRKYLFINLFNEVGYLKGKKLKITLFFETLT